MMLSDEVRVLVDKWIDSSDEDYPFDVLVNDIIACANRAVEARNVEIKSALDQYDERYIDRDMHIDYYKSGKRDALKVIRKLLFPEPAQGKEVGQ